MAHLPWKAFMYKAFNTFIDDVFAFAIAMPTIHRLACLRDDLVFFVYLYQRYLYPVDKKRVNEFGRAYEEEDEDGARGQEGEGRAKRIGGTGDGEKKTETDEKKGEAKKDADEQEEDEDVGSDAVGDKKNN